TRGEAPVRPGQAFRRARRRRSRRRLGDRPGTRVPAGTAHDRRGRRRPRHAGGHSRDRRNWGDRAGAQPRRALPSLPPRPPRQALYADRRSRARPGGATVSGSQARRVAAVATVFAIGAAVMFFFQGPARIVGVAALFTFIVAGLFLVAS